MEAGYPQTSTKWIQPYFSAMSKLDKNRIAADFEKPSAEAPVRMIFATDAYGLGIDNPDVNRVVQWLLPPNMSSLFTNIFCQSLCRIGLSSRS